MTNPSRRAPSRPPWFERGLLALIVILLAAGAARGEPRPPFSTGKADFAVRVRGEYVPYQVLAVSVMPGETLSVNLARPKGEETYVLQTPDAGSLSMNLSGWRWRAPEKPGLYPLSVRRDRDGSSLTLNVFVLVPRSAVRDGKLNGYPIGSYPSTALKGLAIYKPPRGFIEVTPENENTLVSPHFTLKQFLCKQENGYPKYLVLRERLLLKLELVLETFNSAGHRCDTLHVMSGYRTPYYNAAIGNVKYSRHVWGGAVDVFIDEDPRDGQMDDLNGDGAGDYKDADLLYALIDGLHGTPFYEPLAGGLGRYRRTAVHGPFVHLDVRGFRARWGT